MVSAVPGSSLRAVPSASASYDAAGNMTNDGSHTYTWDAEGRAVTVDGGSTRTFTYNALGERVEWAYPGGAAEMLFDPSGTWLGQAGTYSLVNFGGGHAVLYGGGETYFQHFNSVGSTAMQTKHDGSVVGDIAFYPLGAVWAQPLSGYGYNFASLPARDLASNTDITAFRQYNFTLGRWLSPDPLGGHITNPQSFNRYAYVLNNPTTLTDPLGLYPYTAPATDPCQNAGPKQSYCQQQYAAAWAAALGNNSSGCMAGEYGCGDATSNSSASAAYGEDIFDAMAGDNSGRIPVTTDGNGNIGFTISTPSGATWNPSYTLGDQEWDAVLSYVGAIVSSILTESPFPTTNPPGDLQTVMNTEWGTIASQNGVYSAASDSGFSPGYPGNPNFKPPGFVCVTCGPWTDGGTFPPKAASPAPKPPATGQTVLLPVPSSFP